MQAVVDGSLITSFGEPISVNFVIVLTPLYCKTAKVERSVRIDDLQVGHFFFCQ